MLLTTTEVYDVFTNLKHLSMDNIRVHTGGTNLTKAQQYINKNYKDLKNLSVIVITDGETDWLTNYEYKLSAIYTKRHKKLPGVNKYAVIENNND